MDTRLRTQCVLIEGSLSRLLPVDIGVPQGSILGPLMYTLFTNELPEVIHEAQVRDQGEHDPGGQVWPAYNLGDGVNGNICCYADDTTFTTSDDNPAALTLKLTEKYHVIAEFMANNRLKLNDDKTHLLVMGAGQANAGERNRAQVNIQTPTALIKPSKSEKLLGCWVQDDLKWTEHIRDNKKEHLTRSLYTRLGALKKIRNGANFRTRKMIAEGIIVSKLSYLITLWGGCGAGLRKSLQIILNKAARVVTRLDWTTSTKELLSQCGWLSVDQLIFYHSVLQLHKVRLSGTPMYLYTMHNSWLYQYRTRQAENELVQLRGKPKLELSKFSFKWRAANQYNQLPGDIRKCSCIKSFKVKVKTWIRDNISLD